MEGNDLATDLDAFLAGHEDELIEFRRDLHAHPELSNAEHRTTRRVAQRLAEAGLRPVILPKGTGLLVDIVPSNYSEHDPGAERPVVALRADLDALPLADEKNVPYRSTEPNACHACGHDVHTTVLLGTGLYLAAQATAGQLPGRVRLVFQAAEEAAQVHEAVDGLPESLRKVVVLVYYQGLKYREAADVLSVPVGTVKSRLHAAIQKLNQTLASTQLSGHV